MENTKVPVISAKNLNLWYGDFKALKNISLDVGEREITALIGPSGCGKSTFLKTLNRMNDLVPGVRIEGDVRLKGQDIFARDMELTDLRRRVGMVFQKANPFPMSIIIKSSAEVIDDFFQVFSCLIQEIYILWERDLLRGTGCIKNHCSAVLAGIFFICIRMASITRCVVCNDHLIDFTENVICKALTELNKK